MRSWAATCTKSVLRCRAEASAVVRELAALQAIASVLLDLDAAGLARALDEAEPVEICHEEEPAG